MVSQAILTKMRNGLGIATLTLAGCSSSVTEQAPPSAVTAPPSVATGVPPAAPENPATTTATFPALAPGQLLEFKRLMDELKTTDNGKEHAIYDALNRIGKGTLEPLRKAHESATQEQERYRINYAIRYVESNGNYCPPCGRG